MAKSSEAQEQRVLDEVGQLTAASFFASSDRADQRRQDQDRGGLEDVEEVRARRAAAAIARVEASKPAAAGRGSAAQDHRRPPAATKAARQDDGRQLEPQPLAAAAASSRCTFRSMSTNRNSTMIAPA